MKSRINDFDANHFGRFLYIADKQKKVLEAMAFPSYFVCYLYKSYFCFVAGKSKRIVFNSIAGNPGCYLSCTFVSE